MLIERAVSVPMVDGVRLAVTLYLPDGDGPFPAVIESLPYRKDDDCTGRDWQTFDHLTRAGIAGIRIDIRGTGASTGIIDGEYVEAEQRDTVAVMEWAADQAWCTGTFGMWGISWGGFSALQTAMLAPPGLAAIAPMHATHDRFACDVHYIGGSLHAAEQVDWPPSMISCNALPPDPDIFGDGWYDEWLRRLEATPQWHFEWLEHQRRDAFWLHGSPIADYSTIRCPTLLIGGWLDGYVDGMLELAANLECPTRTLIGPWGHHRPATGIPAPTVDHFDLLARWFGHHLRGDDNGIMEDLAPVTVFIADEPSNDPERTAGRWAALAAWPPPGGTQRVWSLSDLVSERTDWTGPQWVGSHAPAWDRSGVAVASSEQDDANSMTFETEPMPETICLVGRPLVEVSVTTDRSVGLVAARLVAISPDGETRLVTRGNRNLAFTDDLSGPVRPIPGEPMSVRFELMACATEVPQGWRLRLALAGADFPVVWPPGENFTLSVDPNRSTLVLPVVGPDASIHVAIPEAPPARTSPIEELESSSARTVRHGDGLTRYERAVTNSERQPTRDDLRYTHQQSWAVTVGDHDPTTIVAFSVSESRLERDGWSVATTGTFEMTGDAEAFTVSIGLAARHDDAEVFSKVWERRILRVWA